MQSSKWPCSFCHTPCLSQRCKKRLALCLFEAPDLAILSVNCCLAVTLAPAVDRRIETCPGSESGRAGAAGAPNEPVDIARRRPAALQAITANGSRQARKTLIAAAPPEPVCQQPDLISGTGRAGGRRDGARRRRRIRAEFSGGIYFQRRRSAGSRQLLTAGADRLFLVS